MRGSRSYTVSPGGQHMSGLAQDGPPIPRQHKKYWTSRLGKSRTSSFLDKRHKMRIQQQARNRGWTSSAIPNSGRATAGRRNKSSADVQSGSVGRGGFSNKVMPYKDLCNAMFPVLRERRESRSGTNGTLISSTGLQVVDIEEYFGRPRIEQWIVKSRDAQNIANLTLINQTTPLDWVFQYLGGQVTYTMTNTCSHTIELEMMTVQSKRYQTIGPRQRWIDDLANDNTLTDVQTPVNMEATINTLNYRPGKGHASSFRDWYGIIGSKRYTLEPGVTVYHTVKFRPFRLTGKQLNTEVHAGLIPSILPKSQFVLFFQKAVGLVMNSTDARVNIGSSASVGTKVERHQYRSFLQYKGFQTYNTTTLDPATAFTAEQEFNTETEGLEAYTFSS